MFCIIIGDVHILIGLCLIPLDPWHEAHLQVVWQVMVRVSFLFTNGYRILGYYDKGKIVVNLGCYSLSYIDKLIQYEGRGWVKGGRDAVDHYLTGFKVHFMRINDNLV